MKKLIAGIGLMAMLLMVAGAVQAASVKNILDNSSGTISTLRSILADISNFNDADINNNSVASTANSGGNAVTSTDDQSGTVVSTGATDSDSIVDNVANTNSVAEDYETTCACTDEIDMVDDDSDATIDNDDTLENLLDNDNDVTVDNNVDSTGDSGNNTVNSGDSLTGTQVTSGASQSGTGVLNTFNTNLKDIIRRVRLP